MQGPGENLSPPLYLLPKFHILEGGVQCTKLFRESKEERSFRLAGGDCLNGNVFVFKATRGGVFLEMGRDATASFRETELMLLVFFLWFLVSLQQPFLLPFSTTLTWQQTRHPLVLSLSLSLSRSPLCSSS
uniref:Uncharacterized protein n=1 Tax=Populus davidiana TaxID=266767 RepID=A0A6M2FDB0_9ROSI